MRDFLGVGKLSKKSKKEFSYYVKIMTIKKQENLCAKCNESLSGKKMPVFHYKNKIISDNSEENCQALHPDCYEIIIKNENCDQINSVKKEYPKLPTGDDDKFYKLDYKDLI